MDRTKTTQSPTGLHHLWGRSTEQSSVPLHYPLLAVLAIVASVAATTWVLPRERGYLISFGVLFLILVYGVLFSSVRLTPDPVFLVVFGGYWLGLVVHYYYMPHEELFRYILVTPVAVYATVVVLPQFIVGRRQTFTMALTSVAVVVAAIGLVMLWQELGTEEELYRFVGEEVMGLYAVRTVSVFHNPNTYGFFMMVGGLTALYTYLTRRGAVWLAAFGISFVGLLLAEGDAALFGFVFGSVVVLSGVNRYLGLVGIGMAVLGVYAGIRIGHVPEVMETTLMSRVDRWVASVERLTRDPLFGIGFVDPGPEIGESRGPHNSYIHVLLNTGLIAGSLYIGALVYALGHGIRKQWTLWNAFVVASTSGILLFMFFESLFLGGLSVTSVTLGIFVGLSLLPEGTVATESTTLKEFKRSRMSRTIEWIRGLALDGSSSSSRFRD